MTREFVKKVGFEGLAEPRRISPERPALERSDHTHVEEVVFRGDERLALLALPPAGAVDEYPPHGVGRGGVQMHSIVPACLITSSADQEAQAVIKASEASLAASRQQLTVLDADIAAARASLAQAEADLETAQLNLTYTEIRSSIDGYIGNRAAQVGAYVASGAYLLSVIPAHGLWVDANFKEDQLARMRPGQQATVVADVLPGKTFHGHVESLAPGTGAIFSVIPPENATGNFTKIVQRVPVRIALDDADARLGELRPGLSTTVSVDTKPGAQTSE